MIQQANTCAKHGSWLCTPNLSTNIVPTNIARLKLSGKSPTDMRIPTLQIKIVLESNPRKSTMLVRGLGVHVSSMFSLSTSHSSE